MPIAAPVEPLQVANGCRPFAVTAERRELAQSQQVSRCRRHGVNIKIPRPAGDEAGLMWLDPVGRGRQAVDIVPAQRRESCVETRWRADDSADPDVGGQQPAQTPNQRQELRLRWPRRAGIGIRQRVHRNVEMGDLTGGVHAGVRAPGRAQPHRGPEHRRERLVEQAGHRTLTCLRGPAGEIRSVISDIEPKTNAPAIGVDDGCVVQR